MPNSTVLGTLAGIVCAVSAVAAAPGDAGTIPLAGTWSFRLDPGDVGLAEEWFAGALPDTIQLPGTTDLAGQGASPPATWVQWRRPAAHVGPAWYQRRVVVPESWAGAPVELFLERVHIRSRVWVNGEPAGEHDSLSVPHAYEVGEFLQAGANTITVRVDNTIPYGINPGASSVTNDTQTNWNGIVGRIELRRRPDAWLDEVQVYPDLEAARVRFDVTIAAAEGSGERRLLASVYRVRGNRRAERVAMDRLTVPVDKGRRTVSHALKLPEPLALWDEFNPNRYELALELADLDGDAPARHQQSVRFGVRRFAAEGRQLLLNGQAVFLRGTLECAAHPQTGHPPTDVAAWRALFRRVQDCGLNHVRFHSWCPPEAAFEAADELGMILQPEGPQWGAIEGNPETEAYVRRECLRIIREYGNHPSFCLFAPGNELTAPHGDFLPALIAELKQADGRRLYTTSSGWPMPLELSEDHVDDFYVSAHTPKGWLRGQGRFDALPPGSTKSDYVPRAQAPDTTTTYAAALDGIGRPVVTHEIGQWAAHPVLTGLQRYEGLLQPGNYRLFREAQEAKGLLRHNPDVVRASGAFQMALYKEEIESALRTPGLAGFQLLGLNDYPGQGTAMVGALDVFWRAKPFASPQAYRRFCAPTVLLAELPARVYEDSDTLEAAIRVAHYGPTDLENVRVEWRLVAEGGVVAASGRLQAGAVARGGTRDLGKLAIPLDRVAAPAACELRLRLVGRDCANSWDLWVYPADAVPDPGRVVVADAWGDAARDALRQGRSVLLLLPPDAPGEAVPNMFIPVFWSWVYGYAGMNAPATYGILCDPSHPAFALFPNDGHSDWQWWDLLHGSWALVLDAAAPGHDPLIRSIDTVHRNLRMGPLLEARVGEGRVMVSTLNLRGLEDGRPAARQFLRSVLRYMNSPEFVPDRRMALPELERLVGAPPGEAHIVDGPARRATAVLDVTTGVGMSVRRPGQEPVEGLPPALVATERGNTVNRRTEGFALEMPQHGYEQALASWQPDRRLPVTVSTPVGFRGTLYVHLVDTGRARRCRVMHEGRDLGILEPGPDEGIWLGLPVNPAMTADGRIEFAAEALTGPNVLLARIVLAPGG